MKQSVLDIQRFSLHDGPGIRTTIFLKGCPLNCIWCCNPESQSPRSELSYDVSKCNHCGLCITECPNDVFALANNRLSVDSLSCDFCGDCTTVCESEALKIYGYPLSPAAIIKETLKDRTFYEASGGGITLSGGECMMQPVFVLELLKAAKSEGLHTCIETCGFAQEANFAKILPYTDLFLFDFKMADQHKHKAYTGQSNELILRNLEFLNSNGAEIILRCPIIPGVNDTLEHFDHIAALYHKLKGIKKVEVLPYHNFGDHKYEPIGKPSPNLDIASVAPELANRWRDILAQKGCVLN